MSGDGMFRFLLPSMLRPGGSAAFGSLAEQFDVSGVLMDTEAGGGLSREALKQRIHLPVRSGSPLI